MLNGEKFKDQKLYLRKKTGNDMFIKFIILKKKSR